MPRLLAVLFTGVLVVSTSGLAQKLPPPSRTVFRCEVAGKVTYSDAPCLGATKVDVEPTRGLNKSTGTERIGADVRKERLNEQLAEAFKPVLNETPEQRAKRHHRARLQPDARQQCGRLDERIAATEMSEKHVTGTALSSTQQQLLDLRNRNRSLGC